jgi:hypothetical protein
MSMKSAKNKRMNFEFNVWALRSTLLLSILFLIRIAQASEAAEEALLVSGYLSFEKLESIAGQIGERPTVSTIRFENCLGGQLKVAEALADYIRKRKLKTIAAGRVYSGCHLAYLAGTPREIADTKLGVSMLVHGPSREGKRASKKVTENFVRLIREYSDGRIPERYLTLIGESFGDGSGLVFSSKKVSGKLLQTVEFCHQDSPGEASVCTVLEEVSFAEIGFTSTGKP